MQVSNGYRKNFPKYLTNIDFTVNMCITYETYDQMAEDISRNKYLPQFYTDTCSYCTYD